MTKSLDKNESVKVEVVKPAAEPTKAEKTAQTPVSSDPVHPQIRQRKKLGLFGSIQLFLRVFLLIAAAGVLIFFGYLFGTKVIPEIKIWLADHNFIEKEVNETLPPQVIAPETGNKGESASSIADIVQRVSPGVVSIAVANASLDKQNGVVQSSDKIGTGFVIDASGVIVTNQHVVRDTNAQYQVITSDEKVITPKKIVRDPFNDIAFVFVDAKDLKVLSMGDSEKIRVGETVIAIGTPLGQYPGSVTVGVISGVNRNVTASSSFLGSAKQYENVLQTDAAVNPGNSGGPLINGSGAVIGVNFATTSGAENISFALPINLVKARLSEYKQYGKFRSPYLGVSYAVVSEQEAALYGVKAGAFIRSVVTGSPADVAGIKPGDIVTKVGKDKVGSGGIVNLLQKLKIGDEIDITVWRQDDGVKTGKEIVLKATVGEAPEGN